MEFKKGDVERGIPIEDNSVDVVISNCVINLTVDKVTAFKEIHRILRNNGRMVISDLITDKEVPTHSVDSDKWCSCIDGALTKENYLTSIRKAGFQNHRDIGREIVFTRRRKRRSNQVDDSSEKNQ